MKIKHWNATACVALTLVLPAGADIIYSGLLDTAIPTAFTGTTVQVGDGTLNPFFGGVGVANNDMLQPGRVGSGNLDAIRKYGTGVTIDSAMTLDAALGYGGSSTHLGSDTALQFQVNQVGYLGFKLDGTNYGWMRVVFTNNTGGAKVLDWAYDNSAGSIATGNVLQNGSTVTLDSTLGSFTVGSQITGGNRLVKSGANSATLTGTNSFSGATTISNGTLLVNGSITGSGDVSVDSGATLGGTGSLAGALNVTGVLSPGASIQSLASGALTMTTGSTFLYEASDNSSIGADLMVVDGALSLTGVTLDLTGANFELNPWAIGDKLTLISYTGTEITTGFTGYTDDTIYTFGTNQWRLNYNDAMSGNNFSEDAPAPAVGNSYVTMTAVPEPNVAMLLGSLGLLVLLRRRRIVASVVASPPGVAVNQ